MLSYHFRYVGDGSDGCLVFQCLECYSRIRIDWGYQSPPHCAGCGTSWEFACITPKNPRHWQPEPQRKYLFRFEVEAENWKTGLLEWEPIETYGRALHAKHAKDILRRLRWRSEHGGEPERYRVVPI